MNFIRTHHPRGFRLTPFVFTLVLTLLFVVKVYSVPPIYAFSLLKASKSPNQKTVKSLEGINWVEGFVIDRNNKDIILFGRKKEGLPQLHLEDFILSLKNLEKHFIREEGGKRYYSPPACSIDPNPKTLAKLNGIQTKLNQVHEINKKEKVIDQYLKVCKEPQNVSVFGIPFQSHFAKVMVDADYHMKRVVDGSLKMNLDGMYSLTELYIAKMQETLEKKGSAAGLQALNRFWFISKGSNYLEHDELFSLSSAQIALTSEQEYTDTEGNRSQTGKVDTLSQVFTYLFTNKFDGIKKEYPIYMELENLYRWMTLAKIIQNIKDSGTLPFEMDTFLNSFQLSEVKVKAQLPGRSNIIKQNIRSEKKEWQILAPTCGGVNMAVEITKKSPETSSEKVKWEELKNKILTSENPGKLSWKVEAM